jgi:two-component system, cell cycle response regulator
MRILLVEPSRTVRRIVADMIEAWDHEVCCCANADEALSRLQSDADVRALITSGELPSISGFQLVAKARALVGTNRPLYIVLRSSHDEYSKCIQALDNGADDFISKPPIAEELRARLRTADRVTAMQRELCRLASTDFLTGLPNRRAFFDNAAKAVEQAQLGHPLSALMLDLDRFKQINDTYGHDIGDEVLKRVAIEIASLPGTGRLGGEEFVILSAMRLEDSAEMADGIRKVVGELRVPAMNSTVAVTCSIGVAEWEPGDTIDKLLRRADVALYEAKRSGRNRVVAADSFTTSKNHEQWRGAARIAGR